MTAEQKNVEVIIVEELITEEFEVHFKALAQSITVFMSGRFGYFYANMNRPQFITATLNAICNRKVKYAPGNSNYSKNKIKEWHIYGSGESLRVAFELK